MDEEAENSWIRRTKFSHTICYRLDSSKLSSIPLSIQEERFPRLKSRPSFSSPSQAQISASSSAKAPQKPLVSKQRSLSPLMEKTIVSDTFKEARKDLKRFSTPLPQRSKPEKKSSGKFFSSKEPKESKSKSNYQKTRSSTSPLRHLGSMKISDRPKSRKDSSWAKYFDHGGVRVTAVDEWMVDLSQLFLGLRFAHGAHSRLYHGIYKEQPVAVKIITVPDDDENGAMAARLENQFSREVSLLSRIHHQNVIKFVAACRKPPVFCVVTEYLSEGSLRAFLHKLEHKTLPLEKVMGVALDIARGMEFIHAQGVIHRDLKPENILIDQDFRMKIADFGIACEEAYCDALADDPGTYRWMAPEMIKHKSYGKKVDVYSFGLILWEMISGSIPYEDMNPIQAAFAVVNKKLRPAIPEDCPPAMKALIEQCWSSHPDKRPDFWQLVKVLEQFAASLARDGTLSLTHNPICQDHKKKLLHWIQKLGPVHSPASTPMPKPKFS
uniref:non-specific serine/threonine protein kinase n=1 Tax=Kalanchoe fedtschenkoi TaxID=63787 RepID=A0A7N0SWM8_KALFE